MEINLNTREKRLLLKIARDSISEFLIHGKIKYYSESSLPPSLLQTAGAFVTLHRKGKLRGCIGRFNSEDPLFRIVQKMAISSATRDHRFKPFSPEEIPEMLIEISVLSPLKKINSTDEFNPDIHGIYMEKEGKTGTYLPQVAKQTRWTKEELLGHCARDKAGLNWDDWRKAKLCIYTAEVFGE